MQTTSSLLHPLQAMTERVGEVSNVWLTHRDGHSKRASQKTENQQNDNGESSHVFSKLDRCTGQIERVLYVCVWWQW